MVSAIGYRLLARPAKSQKPIAKGFVNAKIPI